MEVLEAITGRRAINYFDPSRELSEESIWELLRLASLAPSSFNLQPWQVIVVRSQEMKRRLRECAMGQPKVEEASVVLVMVADPDAVERMQGKVIEDRIEKGYMKDRAQAQGIKDMMMRLYGPPGSLKRKVFAVKNTALFAMNLMIAARGMGLETHPMDGFDEEAVKALLGVSGDKLVPMLVAVGHPRPGLRMLPRPFRRDLEEFVVFC